MNKTISEFVRRQIIEGLHKLPESNFIFFKQMYCHKNMEFSISEAVLSIPDKKLDWVLSQVERTLLKNKED